MNYATIKYCDIANGEGVRTSLFVSGCRRHCPNCFNAVAWDFNYGEPFTKEVRNCCPSSKTSRRCTPARPYGAIPATILSRKFCGQAAAAAR